MSPDQYYRKVAAWRQAKGFDAALFDRCLAFADKDVYRSRWRLLDVGCNDGAVQEEIARRYPLAEVAGVDSNPVAVSLAQSIWRNVTLASDDLAVGRSVFDVVTCFAVVAHMRDPRAKLAAMAEALKVGGLLIIETPDPRYDRLLAWKHFLTGYKGDPTIQQTLSPASLQALLPAGLETVLLTPTGLSLPWYMAWSGNATSDYLAVFRKTGS